MEIEKLRALIIKAAEKHGRKSVAFYCETDLSYIHRIIKYPINFKLRLKTIENLEKGLKIMKGLK
jgi:hypothetical protein